MTNLTEELLAEMRNTVDHGADTLDEHKPGWHNTVRGAMTRGLFDMRYWSNCMVGTLEMARYDTIDGRQREVIAFNGFAVRIEQATEFGFTIPESIFEHIQEDVYEDRTIWYTRAKEAWVELDRLWRLKVDERLSYDALPWWRKFWHPKPSYAYTG